MHLGIGPAKRRLLSGLVASRALAPSSKLAAARWISQDVLISYLPARTDDTCNRTMDWLRRSGASWRGRSTQAPARAGNAPYDVRERACQGEHPGTATAYRDRRSRVWTEPGSASKLSSQ